MTTELIRVLKIGFNSWYYYFINNIFEEKMSDIEKAYAGLSSALGGVFPI
jgi:hypothetical protein